MNCSKCGYDNSPGMDFCGRCGTALARVCPGCLAEVPPDHAFCGQCGTRVGVAGDQATSGSTLPATEASADAPDVTITDERSTATPGMAVSPSAPVVEGERRTVTVLFADLSGFTTLAERLDPEDLRWLLHDYFGELREEILLRGGWAAKYIGDAVLAVFGAPVAHEDDPVRAVRTALGMTVRLEAMNRRLEIEIGQPLEIHVGVNTGLVVTGPPTREDRDDFTVLGDAVNVGARLQQAATAGEIVVGEATYAASRWAFEYQELPPLDLKGKSNKVAAYLCLGPRSQPLSPRGIEGMRAPLLGRERELAALEASFAAVEDGGSQIVALVGDAGIGKSRLAHEFVERLLASDRLDPDRYWIAEAVADHPEPFGVARTLLTPAIETADEGPVEDQLGQLLSPDGQPLDDEVRYLDPEHRKQRLYLLAHQLVATRAAERPLLVVVEDLHWADDASVDLLRFLVGQSAAPGLMFLVTHRPALEMPITSNRVPVRSIALEPLSDELTTRLLRAFFGESFAAFPSEMVRLIVERSEGNPYYTEELVRALIQQGVITRQERWTVAAPSEQFVVPDSIQGLVLTAMDQLDTELRLLLQEASVLGLTFSDELLNAYATTVVDDGPVRLAHAEWLETAINPASGEVTYRFRHVLARDVAYESVLMRVRRALHQRAAATIEELYTGRLDDHLLELATHHERAGDVLQAAAYYERAGDRARGVFANAEAADAYERALDLLSDERPDDRARVNALLAEALRSQGRLEDAVRRWQDALEHHDASGQREAALRTIQRLANALWTAGRVEEAARMLERGLALLGDDRDSPEAAALFQELASQALHRGEMSEAIAWAESAVATSERLETPEQLALAETIHGVALARAGDTDAALAAVERGLKTAREHDLPLVAGRAAVNLAVIYANVDPLRAAEICEQGLAEARRVGDVEIESWFQATLAGSLHACASDYETATRAAEVSIEIDRQIGLPSHLPVPLMVLGQIHQCHARYEQAEELFAEALTIARELGDPQLIYPALEGLGTLALEVGDEERGAAHMREARALLDEAGIASDDLVLLPFLL